MSITSETIAHLTLAELTWDELVELDRRMYRAQLASQELNGNALGLRPRAVQIDLAEVRVDVNHACCKMMADLA
jgi:hypothetical protein